jgi:hypothetical protein
MKKDWEKPFYYFSWAINLVLPWLVFGVFTEGFMRIYYNSDTLYLASIYKDLFEDGTGFRGWNLNGAPNFFPDMLMYFVVRVFAGDFKLAYVIFSIIQYCLIVLLLGNLFKGINPKINRNYITLFNLLFPVYLLATILHGSFQYTFDVFSQSYHNGCFINTLIALNFFFRYINQQKKQYLAWTLVFVFLGIFNDRLFLVTFFIPIITVWLFNIIWLKNKWITRAGWTVTATFILGLIAFSATKSNPIYSCISLGTKFMNIKNAGPSLHNLLSQHTDFIVRADLRGLITILTILSYFTLIYLVFCIFKQTGRFKNLKNRPQPELVFILFSLTSVFITLFTPVINGYYLGPSCIRYTTFSFFLSMFNVVFIVYYWRNSKNEIWQPWVIGTLIAFYLTVIVVTIISKPVFSNINKVITYYPEKVKTIDEFAKKHELKYGVAGYWDAKYTTMFSKEDLRVYTIYNSKLKLWYHVMNSNWYYDYAKGKYNHPVFNFLIINEIDPREIKQNFGTLKDSLYFEKKPLLFVIDSFKFDRKTRSPYLIHQ